ncbi:MAG: hypothetical protein K1W19_07370, partial [Lachnospiraceae bacterium]
QFLPVFTHKYYVVLQQVFMSVFRFPCSHAISITQTTTFGYLNPPSKASGIAVAIISNYSTFLNLYKLYLL